MEPDPLVPGDGANSLKRVYRTGICSAGTGDDGDRRYDRGARGTRRHRGADDPGRRGERFRRRSNGTAGGFKPEVLPDFGNCAIYLDELFAGSVSGQSIGDS